MLASLAFPYTLDTGETITHGTCMECLFVITCPKAYARRIWLSLRHTYNMGQHCARWHSFHDHYDEPTKFIRALLFVFRAAPLPHGSLPAPPAAAEGGPRGPPATAHGSGKLRRRGHRAEPPGRAACLSLETRPALPRDHRQPPAGRRQARLPRRPRLPAVQVKVWGVQGT